MMIRRAALDPALRRFLARDLARVVHRDASPGAPMERLRHLLAKRGWKNVWTLKRPEMVSIAAEAGTGWLA
jgi:hypothetical protein